MSARKHTNNDWLREDLLKSGKATLEAMTSVQQEEGEDYADALVKNHVVTEEDIAKTLAGRLHLEYVPIDDEFGLTREEVRLIPEHVAKRFGLIALNRYGDDSLKVVMSNPLDLEAVDTVRSLTHMDVHRAVGDKRRIMDVIARFYSDEAYLQDSLVDIAKEETEDPLVLGRSVDVDSEKLKVLANDPPVVKFVNLILREAVRDGASDIHFEPGEHNVVIRIRIDGQLRIVPPPPKHLHKAIVTRIKILSDMDIAERRLPQDGRFKFEYHGRVIDVRVSSLPEIHGEKVVLRLLDRSSLKTNMSDIGFEPDVVERFQKILHLPNGIILLTGPTGSGKTTTLYGALEYLRNPRTNIQTVEDPVEYQIDGINQMAIKPSIGLDFAQALRFILRQDPDTILIGEIRDLETAQIAMRASLTGHLVLSTLHTNDAPSAFWRLRDIGVPPYLTAATLRLVISQRLIRKLCGHCKNKTDPSEEMLQLACAVCSDASSWTFMSGSGCVKCGKTGFSGRSAIVEFLEVTVDIRRKIAESVSDVEMKQAAIASGMRPLVEDGLQKVKEGKTTIEEVMSVCPIEYSSLIEVTS